MRHENKDSRERSFCPYRSQKLKTFHRLFQFAAFNNARFIFFPEHVGPGVVVVVLLGPALALVVGGGTAPGRGQVLPLLLRVRRRRLGVHPRHCALVRVGGLEIMRAYVNWTVFNTLLKYIHFFEYISLLVYSSFSNGTHPRQTVVCPLLNNHFSSFFLTFAVPKWCLCCCCWCLVPPPPPYAP